MKTRNSGLHLRTFRTAVVMALLIEATARSGQPAHAPDLDPQLLGRWSSTGGEVNAVVVQDDFAYVATSPGWTWDGQAGTDILGGLQVISISDPVHPRTVGSYHSDSWNGASDVAVSGNYAYLAMLHNGFVDRRLEVIDVSNPTGPRRLGHYETGRFPTDIATLGNCLYVAEASDGKGQLEIIDVSNPVTPRRIGNYALDLEARQIAVSGQFAYVAEASTFFFAGMEDDSRMEVFDVSDPSNPRPVGRHEAVAHAFDVAVSGGFAYVTDSTPANDGPCGQGMFILDISDPAHPRRTGRFGNGRSNFARRVAVLGDYALLAAHGAVLILDISNRTDPRRIGSVAMPEGDSAVDLFIAGHCAYIAASDGLQVLDLRKKANPSRVGSYDTRIDALAVTVAGNHAYVATTSWWDGQALEEVPGGLAVINITDPARPSEAGRYDARTGYAEDVCLAGIGVTDNRVAGGHSHIVRGQTDRRRRSEFRLGQ